MLVEVEWEKTSSRTDLWGLTWPEQSDGSASRAYHRDLLSVMVWHNSA